MLETLPYENVSGKNTRRQITVYALSTCGFCKRAMDFLRTHDIAFRYLYMDNLDEELHKSVKARLTEEYGQRVRYPFTVIDGDTILVGFIKFHWEDTLEV